MKNFIYALAAVLTTLIVIQSCTKELNPNASQGQLVAVKTAIKIHEPDSLALIGAQTTDVITWTVTPAGFETLITNNNTASVSFSKSGTYTINALANGGAPTSLVLTVADSVYNGPTSNVISLAGDQIKLEPAVYKSVDGDTSYVFFKAKTTNAYCNTGRLNFTTSVTENNYAANFISVLNYGSCAGTPVPMAAGVNFNQGPAILANGTYPLSITLNGTNYTGSIIVSSADITFNWAYTNGVTISPLKISR
jgi:hypothetical protein